MSTTSDYLHLPVSSILESRRPSHPVLQFLLGPALPRIAYVESRILLSLPASALRRIGFSTYGILVTALISFFAALVRWKSQWRSWLTFLTVAEAIGRTIKVLEYIDRFEDPGSPSTLSRPKVVSKKLKEIQRLLSFWALFGFVSFFESILSSAEAPPTKFTFLDPRPAYRQLAKIRPYLLKIRSLLKPYITIPLPKTRPSFPQPSKLSTLAHPPSVVANWFSSELGYRVSKVLFFWTALRSDIGALAIWNYVIGPLYTVRRKRSVDSRGVPISHTKRVVVLSGISDMDSDTSEPENDDSSSSPHDDPFLFNSPSDSEDEKRFFSTPERRALNRNSNSPLPKRLEPPIPYHLASRPLTARVNMGAESTCSESPSLLSKGQTHPLMALNGVQEVGVAGPSPGSDVNWAGPSPRSDINWAANRWDY